MKQFNNKLPVRCSGVLSAFLAFVGLLSVVCLYRTKFKLLVYVQSGCTKSILHCNKYIKIQKQRIRSTLQLRDLKNRTPTPLLWYQVHRMKTFKKRNQMHKYGVVYLNTRNGLYVAKYMSRMLQFHRPQARKTEC